MLPNTPKTNTPPQPPAKAVAYPSAIYRRRLLALAFWLLLILGYYSYTGLAGIPPAEAARRLADPGAAEAFGALVYLVLWVLRPLLLFPAGVLAAAAGFVFGPVAGVGLAFIGGNLSASVAYLLGRYFGGGLVEGRHRRTRTSRYADRLRDDGFEAVLAAQLVYLPFDLVNCTAGFIRIRWRRFALATLLGTLPGTVSFVLLGAALGTNSGHPFILDTGLLTAAVGVFLISILACRYVKRRGHHHTHNPKGEKS